MKKNGYVKQLSKLRMIYIYEIYEVVTYICKGINSIQSDIKYKTYVITLIDV
jgi:hypothetical protein